MTSDQELKLLKVKIEAILPEYMASEEGIVWGDYPKDKENIASGIARKLIIDDSVAQVILEELYKDKVVKALENPKYTWRTVRGISKEIKIWPDIVRSSLSANGDIIVQSTANNEKGEPLFASRKIYKDKVSPYLRIFSAIKNRGGAT